MLAAQASPPVPDFESALLRTLLGAVGSIILGCAWQCSEQTPHQRGRHLPQRRLNHPLVRGDTAEQHEH
jgi:hypothetical protein